MGRFVLTEYPDPVLEKKALPVRTRRPGMGEFFAQMRELMQEHDGVGLASPQVGVSLRAIVVEGEGGPSLALCDPEIVEREGEQTGTEGCLSLPGVYAEVTRAARVTVRGTNERGRVQTLSGEGLWARAVQHEADHLDGVVFIDRANAGTIVLITGEKDADDELVETPATREEAVAWLQRRKRTAVGAAKR